jgi:putative transposase
VAKIQAGLKPGQSLPKGTGLPISKNRQRETLRLQKTHLRIRNIRQDFTHKTTSRLCRENQALGWESLNVAGMLKNDKLALALSDVGMGEFSRQIKKYKTKLYGTRLCEADRWFPSSKLCSVCKFVHGGLQLSDRVWKCPNCGTVHDRDINAAINLKQLATVETALPVASPTVMQDADASKTPEGSSVGKVTPVSYDSVLKKDQGRKTKAAKVDSSSLLSTF